MQKRERGLVLPMCISIHTFLFSLFVDSVCIACSVVRAQHKQKQQNNQHQKDKQQYRTIAPLHEHNSRYQQRALPCQYVRNIVSNIVFTKRSCLTLYASANDWVLWIVTLALRGALAKFRGATSQALLQENCPKIAPESPQDGTQMTQKRFQDGPNLA